ncbi:MAG: antibiotic biosynthesis monooxygenase [Pseudomonadota bacterium]
MPARNAPTEMIMRLFEVRAKPGCVPILLEKFATTSADVVQNAPGHEGYFFGDEVSSDDDRVIFASLWTNLEAVQARFGASWRESFLPAGYEDLIEACSIRHIRVGRGWFPRSQ